MGGVAGHASRCEGSCSDRRARPWRSTPIASTWAAPKVDPDGIGVWQRVILRRRVRGMGAVRNGTKRRRSRAARVSDVSASILQNAPNLPFMRENCSVWNVPAVPSVVRAATESSIPALVINSQYDAQTAASFGSYVARKLPNATVVTIPNIAHVAFGSPSAAANACA